MKSSACASYRVLVAKSSAATASTFIALSWCCIGSSSGLAMATLPPTDQCDYQGAFTSIELYRRVVKIHVLGRVVQLKLVVWGLISGVPAAANSSVSLAVFDVCKKPSKVFVAQSAAGSVASGPTSDNQYEGVLGLDAHELDQTMWAFDGSTGAVRLLVPQERVTASRTLLVGFIYEKMDYKEMCVRPVGEPVVSVFNVVTFDESHMFPLRPSAGLMASVSRIELIAPGCRGLEFAPGTGAKKYSERLVLDHNYINHPKTTTTNVTIPAGSVKVGIVFPGVKEACTASLRSTKVRMGIDLGKRSDGGKMTGRATLTPYPSQIWKPSLCLEGVSQQPWDVSLVRPDSQQPMHSLPLAQGAEHYDDVNRLILPTQAISDAMQVREPFEDGQGRQRERGAGEVLERRQGAVESAVELYYRNLSLDQLGITILEDTPRRCRYRLEFPPPAATLPYDLTATQQLVLSIADVQAIALQSLTPPHPQAPDPVTRTAGGTSGEWRFDVPRPGLPLVATFSVRRATAFGASAIQAGVGRQAFPERASVSGGTIAGTAVQPMSAAQAEQAGHLQEGLSEEEQMARAMTEELPS
ncbi:unnamed protein product [Vitrella brassicaformis CCMP3155]|uniref:Uncharacterized protein n=1 Tax=Vitrella brassicaformis (strain CCMP3155) TaxID=1169540 RepID=A0A0G4ERR7_VITBC|nr:unnamed protein product [Vitrella brassicaformis CCMP3155]|eukprot:CEM00899.1 unnamed protein product [Vitrella brassicaformis CCMP3155]